MKTFSILALLLATSRTFAAQSRQKTSHQPLQLTQIHANQSTYTGHLRFTLHDPNTKEKPTGCKLEWNKLAPVEIQPKCDDGQWGFSSPSGIENITDFTLQLERISHGPSEKGQVELKAGQNGWQCQKNPPSGVEEECLSVDVMCVHI
ncbi:hypothetical protein N7510_003847 [Penicillium lagena]|uniref:uncharacterized protein n=1 Tax=Penicillium lagena TaxID=94218 RepID=UPI0025405DDF|nr:uncharacterized protein N7510_003847 [Penicillium lagena]KAJ5619863.1 hypothetical protein N7510_003847 [Penicillium lagena]